MNIADVKPVVMTQRLRSEWNRECRQSSRQREQEETSCNQAETEKMREDWSGEKLKKNVRREGQREDTRLKVDCLFVIVHVHKAVTAMQIFKCFLYS